MLQAPAATATGVQRPPARPKWRLAGHEVTQDMFYAAQQARRAGRRCFYVHAGDNEISKFTLSDEDCGNCGGFGHMALEVVVAGPFPNAPQGKQGSAEEQPAVHVRPAWHNGAWWSVVRELYDCPVCSNTREINL